MRTIIAVTLALTFCGCGHNIVTFGEGFGVRLFSAVVKDNADAEMSCGDKDAPLVVKVSVGNQTTGYEVENSAATAP